MLFFCSFLLGGCGGENRHNAGSESSNSSNKKIRLVVTTTQLYDLAQRLTGDHFSVTSLMGPGVDPHIYKPSSRDILALSKANLVVFHGMQLEGRLAEALSHSEENGISTFNATANLPNKEIIYSNSGHNEQQHPDPHVWFDPKIWSLIVNEFTRRLIRCNPSEQKQFESRANQILDSISKIEEWGINEIKKIPKDQRTLITSHDAFQYLGRAMGLQVIALQGISTTAEAGLADRANLVDLIQDHNIPAIFIESSVNPTAIQEIAKECNVEVGGELFSDALGSNNQFVTGPNGIQYSVATWEGMMVHNINTIVKALRKRRK